MGIFHVSEDKNKNEIDETLFLRIANGDNDAFETLYYATYKPVYAFIFSMLKNKYDAEDILQDTYIKIKGAAHLYQPKGKPLSWIFKIAQNNVRMKMREEKRYETVNYDELENVIKFDKIQNIEERMILQNAFQILDEEEQKIIILYLVSGLKHKEIAELLNKPLSTVLSKYNRSLKKLKKNLAEKEVS